MRFSAAGACAHLSLFGRCEIVVAKHLPYDRGVYMPASFPGPDVFPHGSAISALPTSLF